MQLSSMERRLGENTVQTRRVVAIRSPGARPTTTRVKVPTLPYCLNYCLHQLDWCNIWGDLYEFMLSA